MYSLVMGRVHPLLSLLPGLTAGANGNAYQFKNLILKSARYQVRVQGHIQKRTEKTGVLEDVFHNHDSKSGMTRARTKGLKGVLEPAVHQSFILETLAAMLTMMWRFFPKSCSLVTIVE